MKQKLEGEYVHVDSVGWQPFPGEFSAGGIRWKLFARLSRDGSLDCDF